jgi:hypothetical protein
VRTGDVVSCDDVLNQEVEMSKCNETPIAPTPAPELLCFGSARALTNAPEGDEIVEDELGNKYNP